jgi:putative transposase
MIACDVLTVDTVWLRRLYVLFFIELDSAGSALPAAPNPSGSWVTQQARDLMIDACDRERPLRFLIHDRDVKFSGGFDEVFQTEGVEIIRTPRKAPDANAHAERFVRTLREECLDWLLVGSRRQLGARPAGLRRALQPRARAPSA